MQVLLVRPMQLAIHLITVSRHPPPPPPLFSGGKKGALLMLVEEKRVGMRVFIVRELLVGWLVVSTF